MRKNSLVFVVLILWSALLISCGKNIPKCDNQEVLSLVSDLVSQVHGGVMIAKSIDNVRLVDSKKDVGINTCECDIALGFHEKAIAAEAHRAKTEDELAQMRNVRGPAVSFRYTTQYTTDGKVYVKLYNK